MGIQDTPFLNQVTKRSFAPLLKAQIMAKKHMPIFSERAVVLDDLSINAPGPGPWRWYFKPDFTSELIPLDEVKRWASTGGHPIYEQVLERIAIFIMEHSAGISEDK
jgi:hypothetical protein